MFEIDSVYQDLESQFISLEYAELLNEHSDAAYDIYNLQNEITKNLDLMHEAAKKEGFGKLNNLKSTWISLKKLVEKYKEPALACKPIGLVYKDFKTFISTSEVESMYKKAKNLIDKFNIEKATEDELKEYIKESKFNKSRYNEIVEIFYKGNRKQEAMDVVITSKKDKELTKTDIKDAIDVVEKEITEQFVTNFFYQVNKTSDDYYSEKEKIKREKAKGIDKLRNRAKIAKLYLHYTATSYYLQTLANIHDGRMIQSKRIIVKAANYNPRNLKESFVIQDYIDTMYDFYENC